MEPSVRNPTAARLRACRSRSDETLEQVAQLLGVHKSTLMRWESGRTAKVSRRALDALARHYDVSVHYLMGETALEPTPVGLSDPMSVELPVLGRIPSDTLRLSGQPVEGFEPAPKSALRAGRQYLWLHIVNDEMAPTLRTDDLALVELGASLENDVISVIAVEGLGCLIRRLRVGKNLVELYSDNPMVESRKFSGGTQRKIQVLGTVRRLIRPL